MSSGFGIELPTNSIAFKTVRTESLLRIQNEAAVLMRMTKDCQLSWSLAGPNFAAALAEALRDAAGAILREIDFAGGASSKETPVSDIITAQVLTVTPSESVIECMRIMTEKRVRHLPVMEGTNLVGMLSIGDMVNWFISAQTATIENLERYIGWR